MKKLWLKNAILVLNFGLLLSGCLPGAGAGKISRQTLKWQNSNRSYLIYTPPGIENLGPVPVLFHLHGGGGTARGTVGLTFGRFNELADEHGFIVVYPNAIKKNWNDGRKEHLKPGQENVDDVGFLVEVVKEVKQNYQVDAERVFSTGMSNGGFMTGRLLCDRSDVFRGGAVLTASFSVDYLAECEASKPVSFLLMNGTEDPLVPYDGGEVMVFGKARGKILSTSDWLAFWEKKLACKRSGEAQQLPDLAPEDGTRVWKTSWDCSGEESRMVFFRIEGGGHTWPGGKQYLGEKVIGKTCRDINACDVIWDFLSGGEN